MNQALLEAWEKYGFAKKDLGDGAWGWTVAGIKVIPRPIRTLLSNFLYAEKVPDYQHNYLEENGFDSNGFPLKEYWEE